MVEPPGAQELAWQLLQLAVSSREKLARVDGKRGNLEESVSMLVVVVFFRPSS